MIQGIIAGIIVIWAGWMLFRSLRRRNKGDCGCGCGEDCPMRRDCRKRGK